MSLLQRITFLTYTVCSILYFCGYIWASVSMSLLQRITFLTYTVVWHSLFLWLHLGICHFNVFAVENYIFNLYSCVAFFISVVTSGHLSFQCLLQRITFLTYTVVWHSLFLWLHLGICHFNVFAVENYIFNLYSCAAFFISVVTSGHLSFQCLLQRITFLTYTVVWHSLFLWLHLGICHFNSVENYFVWLLYFCGSLDICHFNVCCRELHF